MFFRNRVLDLASKIQTQFKNRAGRIDRGVKQAGFWVLYMTTMPSVLIETGFITNPDEEKYLALRSRDRIILHLQFSGHARDYINEIDKKSYISTGIDQSRYRSRIK